ncbi:hypothetical protein OsJ_22991 [Oryza sativa Japonica Group]|uniref:Protein kinase domain-containing protein n=1 Tax=Oryza sativa subsp. japonica TaxID=39947 RepID=B9FVD0_ORYSJ|nr:hypothetical protein OsJ_22991 [Oryza sativa Japonica Group]
MTFVISSTADFPAASSPAYLGLANPHDASSNPFVAIELDTVADPDATNGNHVAIDFNSLTSNLSRPAGYIYDDEGAVGNSSFQALKLSSGDPMQAWVSYDAGAARARSYGLRSFPMFMPSVPLLSYNVSLSRLLSAADDSPMATKAYFGFTASTGGDPGGAGATHQVLGWSFSNGGLPLDYSLLPLKRAHQGQDYSRSRRANRKSFVTWLPAAASVLAVLAAMAACLVLRWCWKKNARSRENWEAELGPRRFAYRDLRRATDGFKHLLGKGGFGRVYGGVLSASGMPIAVKRVSSESRHGMTQFTAEIIILGRLRHRNLVRLLGYCRHKEELLLVYEHMPNGSLDNAKPPTSPAPGATSPRSSPGSARPPRATDVFAFGAFVLEVACGRRPMGHNARGELLVLVEWVRDAWAAGGGGSVVDTMDPRLEEYSGEEAELVLKLGLLCSHPLPAARPGMRLVMQYLDGDVPLPEFSPDYLCIKDVDQVQVGDYSPSVVTTITGLSGGR